MNRVAYILPAAALASGCLSPAPKAPENWTIGPIDGGVLRADAPKWQDGVRLSRLEVRAPYDAQRLAVLRPDGSVAMDPANAFAAAPSALLRGAAFDVLAASGLASPSVQPGSAASARRSLEVTVTRLALDCRDAGSRKALVELAATLLDGRKIEGTARASFAEDAAEGNYTTAFSVAFARAMADALKRL